MEAATGGAVTDCGGEAARGEWRGVQVRWGGLGLRGRLVRLGGQLSGRDTSWCGGCFRVGSGVWWNEAQRRGRLPIEQVTAADEGSWHPFTVRCEPMAGLSTWDSPKHSPQLQHTPSNSSSNSSTDLIGQLAQRDVITLLARHSRQVLFNKARLLACIQAGAACSYK